MEWWKSENISKYVAAKLNVFKPAGGCVWRYGNYIIMYYDDIIGQAEFIIIMNNTAKDWRFLFSSEQETYDFINRLGTIKLNVFDIEVEKMNISYMLKGM